MKKTSIFIILIVIIVGGFWILKNKPKTPLDKSLFVYNNPNVGVSFSYPKILSASTTENTVTIHHSVPFTHHDYCDFKGEIDTTIDNLSDFNVSFHTEDLSLIQTMKKLSSYIPQENFVNDTIVVSPGFIDSFSVGKLNGYKIFEGAEGCGQTTYYFPVSNSKTLVVKEALVTVFTGAIDTENMSKALAVPRVINKQKSEEILNSILNTIKVK